MPNETKIKFALQFPQGQIIVMKSFVEYNNPRGDGAAYFLPNNGTDAFMLYGDFKELFGKNALSVDGNKDTRAPAYDLVYEFGDKGALTDARLIKGKETVRGTLADEKTVQALQTAVNQGKIALHEHENTDYKRIFNAASFPDGRILIQLMDRELYLGTPGHYEKVDADCIMDSGSGDAFYRTKQGGRIDLPCSYPDPKQNVPTFKGEKLVYMKNVETDEDPSKLGLTLPAGLQPLTPFSAELKAKKTGAVKGPAQ